MMIYLSFVTQDPGPAAAVTAKACALRAPSSRRSRTVAVCIDTRHARCPQSVSSRLRADSVMGQDWAVGCENSTAVTELSLERRECCSKPEAEQRSRDLVNELAG